ncbi:MAG: thermonuclease family protein [SAR324 cluster bacterium]|nr:thermonuclease family protein [SAR324 cluster bacterium]
MLRLLIPFVALVFLLPSALPAQTMLKTESIRQKLFDRMGQRDRNEKQDPIELPHFEGVFSRATDSESVWVRIDNRREFRKWTYKLSKGSLSLPRQEVRVYLDFVSPKLSVSHGKEFNRRFLKWVTDSLTKTFYNRRVRVDYEYSERLSRLNGIVLAADTSINQWMIRNGMSFYLLPEKPPAEHGELLAAEKVAQKKGVGLWKPELQKQ